MAANSKIFDKKLLKDCNVLSKIHSNENGECGCILALNVKNYAKLRKKVIYYKSVNIEDFDWTCKFVIASGTLFMTAPINANLKNPVLTILADNGLNVVNPDITHYDNFTISEFCHKTIVNPNNRYLGGDSLLIVFNYTIERTENNHFSLYCSKNARDYENLKYIYLPSTDDDLKILVGNLTFWGKTTILSACSEVFAQFFQNKKMENKMTCIRLDEDQKHFYKVLVYVYSKKLYSKDIDDMLEVYRIASILKIESLQDKCMTYFNKKFSGSNEMKFLTAGIVHDLVDLKNATCRHMVKNGSQLLQSPEVIKILNFARG